MNEPHNESSVAPAAAYLQRVAEHIAAIRTAVPHLTDMGERMAEPLLAGGNIFTPAIAAYFPNEFCNRAGGLMGVRSLMGGHPDAYTSRNKNNVAWFALPDPRFWKAADDAVLRELLSSDARLFAIGNADELPDKMRRRIAGFTGGAAADEGDYALEAFRPLTSFRPFEQLVRGWVTTGEMITACIRAGKMPIIWMSVWLEGAFARNAAFYDHDNLREPWLIPLFHERRYIPPLSAGYAAGALLDELTRIHARLLAQAGVLARAGQWMAEARRAGRRIHAIAVGHSHPEILELKHAPGYPIQWSGSVSDLNLAVPASIGRGDVAMHLGYSPVDIADVRRILERGVKFIYTSPYGRPAELEDHTNLLWFDLPWRPADATVDIPGYSVRMLPMSSSAHAMAYNAILAEFAERMGWR